MTDYPAGIKRMDDYIGKRVKLVGDVTTRGGKLYEKGTAMYVHGHHRGRLSLTFGPDVVLRQIERHQVALSD